MNIGLLESFGQSYPEELDGTLDCSSIALTCRFNRWGSLLAVGCNDGRILIFDFTTRGIAKVLVAHVQPVCSVSWSRDGRKLITASTDNTVAFWDLLSGECEHRFRFPSPIVRVQFHPRERKRFIICPMKHAAVLMTLPNPESKDGSPAHQVIPVDEEAVSGPDSHTIAAFDRRGTYIITGNGKGKVGIVRTDGMRVIATFRQQSNHAIRSIEVARRGSCFLTNSNDRIIRIYDVEEILHCAAASPSCTVEPVQKLQDLVNKTPWKVCCFSGDGEYVCAGSARTHSISIWECKSGSLVKILHGIKGETLLDLAWHPSRPLICSISNVAVTIWSQSQVENWSAFAPDFKELDENIEYDERESEFDMEDEDRSVHMSTANVDEDVEVDVDTVAPVPAFCSSDEEGEPLDGLWYLPIAPEIDDPEENPLLPLTIVPPDSSVSAPAVPHSPTKPNQAGAVSPTRLPPPMDITLPVVGTPANAGTDVHPLLNASGGRKRGPSGTPPVGRDAGKRKGKATAR